MSNFAKVDNGIVVEVIVADKSFIDTLEGLWLQTSYNTRGGVHYGPDGKPDGGIALRANYAGIGYTYDSLNDVFYEPRPSNQTGVFYSWTINAPTWLWNPPIPYPNDGKNYYWNEQTLSWVLIS